MFGSLCAGPAPVLAARVTAGVAASGNGDRGGGGEACARRVREGSEFDCGLGLREPCYVRAKDLKWATTTLKNWRFKTRFFASFLFAFEKK